jgi:hypothetical protein
VWSLVNLQLLEKLVVSVMGPARTSPEGIRGAGFCALGMRSCSLWARCCLSLLSPMALLLGFLLPLVVIVLKGRLAGAARARASWGGLVNHRFRPRSPRWPSPRMTWFALGALTSATAGNEPAKSHATRPPRSPRPVRTRRVGMPRRCEGEHAAEGGEHSEGGGHGFTNIVA